MSNEQKVTSNEQKITTDEQRAKRNEQRAKRNEQRAAGKKFSLLNDRLKGYFVSDNVFNLSHHKLRKARFLFYVKV